jgi:dihydroflavonol-4-reductase
MVLVTGGTGMLGAHLLVQLLDAGQSVRATYRTASSLEKAKHVFSYFTDEVDKEFSKIEWVQADVRETSSLEAAFQGIEKVYHLAALVSFDTSSYSKMRSVNIYGTANVVNLCLAFKVQKLCFVSSIAAISKTLSKPFIDEQDEFNLEENNYGYAITKYGAEMEVWRAAQEGLQVLIYNPGVILGAGFWRENSGALFSMTYKEFPFYTEGVTGFVGVEDVAALLVKGMDSEVTNERFVVVSENKSFKEIVDSIACFFEKKPPKIKVSKLLSALGWRLSWLKSKLTGAANTFSRHTAKAAHSNSYYRAEKVKKTFEFEFEPMEQVLKKVARRYQKDLENKTRT